ncbi:MAG TPA: 16S rRNA (guanine(527)-N(7))-methyltransferase RsmG [Vicinamibacterales bacterium]|nr:16S rRNA (guanine(527)-N(7))-methyltransferase RsmG [Vicinamibacterales bacterium]
MSREFQDRLSRRIRRAGLTIDSELKSRLATYFELLATWNGKMNLTGFDLSDPTPAAIDRLFIEPLQAGKHIAPRAARAIDIGSGGGSPGIPLLLSHPQMRVLLVEAKTRKAVFLKEAIRALDVSNAEVATARYEELLARPDLHEAHDLLTIRAVRVEQRVLMSLQAFVKPDGELFLFRSGQSGSMVITPPLFLSASHPLLDSHTSTLAVLRKRRVGAAH